MKFFRAVLGFLFVSTLLGCLPSYSDNGLSNERPWLSGDLRLLDPPDETDPSQDILAAYTRVSEEDLEIRVDFLKSSSLTDYDLYLAIDNQPGGNFTSPINNPGDLAWDILISFCIGYPTEAVSSSGERIPRLTPRLYRDPKMDSAIIRLNRSDLGLPARHIAFQVWTTSPTSLTPSDVSAPFHLDGDPPGRAAVLFTFWNTLPAYTPVQALRRWNGAHTGPQGSRHGLYQLLTAADENDVPITLLDLKTPNSLAGLEVLGGLPLVQGLQERNLLLLPDVAFGDPAASGESLALSRKAALAYGLHTSPFVYGAVQPPLSSDYQAAFNVKSQDQILIEQGMRSIPLAGVGEFKASPDTNILQVSQDGLNLELRRRLVTSAIVAKPAITILGGNLQETSWADATTAGTTFAYIAAHPWIWVLSATDLLTWPAQHTQAGLLANGCSDLLCSPPLNPKSTAYPWLDMTQERSNLRTRLSALPAGNLRDLAWQMYLQLTRPAMDANREQLQNGYLGQVNYLLEAARWSLRPGPRSDCSSDIDIDGLPECILASNTLFTILKPQGARLVFAGRQNDIGFEEWVGPSSQFAIGLGDSSEWMLQNGQSADPEIIAGAFADLPDPYLVYRPVIQPGRIEFIQLDGSQTKVFSIEKDHIRMEYGPSGFIHTRILLAVSPQSQFQSGWEKRYSALKTANGDMNSWGLEPPDRISVQINSQPVQLISFLDSSSWMHSPEDPDFNYPPGHFLPFPLAVIDAQSDEPLVVDIGQ